MMRWPGKEAFEGRIDFMPPPLLTIADAGINLGDQWLLRGADPVSYTHLTLPTTPYV